MKLPSLEQIHSIIKQMKEKGISYEDYESEYFEGEHRSYYYDMKKKQFVFERMDVVVGSYFFEHIKSEEWMIDALSEYSVLDFKESGFKI